MLAYLRRIFLVVLYYSPFIVICGIIFWLSSMSHPPIPKFMRFSLGDKVLHSLAFFGVGAAAALGAILRRREVTYKSYLEAWALTLLYALFDEIHQSFTPHRLPSSADWIADAVGAALGIAVFFVGVIYLKRCCRRARV